MNNFTHQSELFRRERLRLGLTQKEVAENLGYSTPQFISALERGLCGVPHGILQDVGTMGMDVTKLKLAIIKDFKQGMEE